MNRSEKWYYGLHLNEYRYKHLNFTKHRTREGAEAKHTIPYSGTCYTDYSREIFKGCTELEKWAEECCYEIDWEKMTLTYKGR
jgi:hypothetical protein